MVLQQDLSRPGVFSPLILEDDEKAGVSQHALQVYPVHFLVLCVHSSSGPLIPTPKQLIALGTGVFAGKVISYNSTFRKSACVLGLWTLSSQPYLHI